MIVDKIVELLNEVIKIDSAAIDSLICLRVPVNIDLMNHPNIQVSCKSNKQFPVFGMLGFLNGLSTKYDNKYIIANYDETTHCLLSFKSIPMNELNKLK